MAAHTDPRTRKMEAKRSEFQGHPQIHNELKISKLHNLSKKKTMSQVW